MFEGDVGMYTTGVPELRRRNAKRLNCETAVRNGPKFWEPVLHFMPSKKAAKIFACFLSGRKRVPGPQPLGSARNGRWFRPMVSARNNASNAVWPTKH
jgi:hypothetical protein